MSAIDSVLLNKIRVGGNTPTQVRVGGEAIKCAYANSELVYDTCKEITITKHLTGSVTYAEAKYSDYSIVPNDIQFTQKIADKGYSGNTYSEKTYNQNNESLDHEYWEFSDNCGRNYLIIDNWSGSISGHHNMSEVPGSLLLCKVKCTIRLNGDEYVINDIPVYLGGGYVPPTPDPDPDPNPGTDPEPTVTVKGHRLDITRTIVYNKTEAKNDICGTTGLDGNCNYRIDFEVDYLDVMSDNTTRVNQSDIGARCSAYGGFTSGSHNGRFVSVDVSRNPDTTSRSCRVTISYNGTETQVDVAQSGKDPEPVVPTYSNYRMKLGTISVYDETDRTYVSTSITNLRYDHSYRIEVNPIIVATNNSTGKEETIISQIGNKCYLGSHDNWISYDRDINNLRIHVEANSGYNYRSDTVDVCYDHETGTVRSSITIGQNGAPEPEPDPTYSDWKLEVTNASDFTNLDGDSEHNITLQVQCVAKNSLTNGYEVMKSNVTVSSTDSRYWCRFTRNNTIQVDVNNTDSSRDWPFDISATVDGHNCIGRVTVQQNAGTPTPDPDPDPDPTDIWDLDVYYASVLAVNSADGTKRGLVLAAPAGTYRIVYATVDADGVPPIDVGSDRIVTLTASTKFSTQNSYEIYQSYGAALTSLYDITRGDPYDWSSLDYEIDAMKK